jgi:hypothetical protein
MVAMTDCLSVLFDGAAAAVASGRPGSSCKEPPVLIALVVSGCMSGPAGPVGGVEFGSEGRVVERRGVSLI